MTRLERDCIHIARGPVLAVLLAASLAAEAQPAPKVYRIGFVTTSAPGRQSHRYRHRGRRRLRREMGRVAQGSRARPSRAAVLWNSANESSVHSAEAIQAGARVLNVKLEMFDAGNAATLDLALTRIAASRTEGIIIAPDPYFNANRTKLVRFAASKRLPAVYFFKSFAEAGGLMAYGANNADSIRMAATYVDRILKGAKPADLPVDQPTRFELVINLRSAKALGLRIPRSLLVRADEVIE